MHNRILWWLFKCRANILFLMKTNKNQKKTMYKISITMFIISIIGVIFVGLYFLSLSGCSFGFFWGTYMKYNKKVSISKKTLLFIFYVALFSACLSLLMLYLLDTENYIYIIVFNLLAIFSCLLFIVKKSEMNAANDN